MAIRGNVAVVVEPNSHIWDLAPTQCLIQEVGGSYYEFSSDMPDRTSVVFGRRGAVQELKDHLT